MESAHRFLGFAAAAGGFATAIVALIGLALPTLDRRWVDRAILATLAIVAANALLGLVLLVAGGHPADPLHYLYALLALGALPVVRFAGGRRVRPRPGLLALAGALVVGFVLRLFQTGR